MPEFRSADPAESGAAAPAGAGVRVSALAVVLAAVGALLAVYLVWVSLAEGGAPAGCGPGSGCERVLAGRWSRWFDVPVAAPAAGVYAGILVAALVARSARSPRAPRAAAAALLALAALAAGAAVWFVGLQVLVLGAFCPWCLALHACGLVLFALVLVDRPRRGVAAPGRARDAIYMTVLGLAVLVAGQMLSHDPIPTMQFRKLGGVQVAPAEHPILGSPDAKHVVVVLADYTCPHCRTLSHQLDAALARYGPGQLAVAVAPVPLNADCNDAITFTERRMLDACDLAQMALAVWLAEPGKFAEMDRWLFDPDAPPPVDEARAHAASLVGEAALAKALADPRVRRRIAANVELYKSVGKGRLPKLLLPNGAVEGEGASEQALFTILEEQLRLAAPARPQTPP